MDTNTKKFLAKANDSFKTKLNLYLFSKVIKQDGNIINLEDFQSFEIDLALVKIYTTEYWQYEPEYELVTGLNNDAIYKQISKIKVEHESLLKEFKNDYIKNHFPKIFSFPEFELIMKQNECDYCQITTQDIEQLANCKQLYKKNYRGWSLEIDRIDSNFEYKKCNCVMACYWCNNAKTDEFTYDEFKEIGKEIRKVWEARLGRKLGKGMDSKF